MPKAYEHTDEFRGAEFRRADFSGATFRDCDLSGVRIVSSELVDFRVSGFGGRSEGVIVDDVDVTEFVIAELDRRYPERVQLRAIESADDHRAIWDRLDELWSATIARAERLPEHLRQERVDGEWSFVETLSHLSFAIDVWIGRMILGQDMPFHRHGLPPTDYTPEGARELGLDLDARPAFAEMVSLHVERRSNVRAVLETLTDDGLDEIRTASPAPEWGTESRSVRRCLRTVFNEHIEHRRFAERDLRLLESREGAPKNPD